MNMDLDLNPEDFQFLCWVFIFTFCLTGFGLDLIILFQNPGMTDIPIFWR